MIVVIANWRGGKGPPVPEAVEKVILGKPGQSYWEVEVENLEAFIEKHGAMIISPPGKAPYSEGWFAWYNNGYARFSQS